MGRSATKPIPMILLSAMTVASLMLAMRLGAADKDPPARPAVGDKAQDFELRSLGDESVKLTKVLADGPVVLVVLRGFPGYQCPVCNAQVSQFVSQAKKFEAAGARVLIVYPGPAAGLKQRADDFVRGKTLPVNLDLLIDPDYEFTKKYGLRWEAKNETAYPATFAIDRERVIRFAKISTTHGGRASVEEVLKALSPK